MEVVVHHHLHHSRRVLLGRDEPALVGLPPRLVLHQISDSALIFLLHYHFDDPAVHFDLHSSLLFGPIAQIPKFMSFLLIPNLHLKLNLSHILILVLLLIPLSHGPHFRLPLLQNLYSLPELFVPFPLHRDMLRPNEVPVVGLLLLPLEQGQLFLLELQEI